ncbi:MAG: restriction endonuclease subunit S [Clostridiales Family XIII bacterium]|jgi:type I restriction enzyme S subunit|nr:restriction endonuclease subunit S [Clostridiales Family XIII bacterium]
MNTKQLRQKILDLAIRGKLVPQDPNDEPASVLLARIAKEKEILVKEGKIKAAKKVKQSSIPADRSHYGALPSGWAICAINDVFIVNPRNVVDDDTVVSFVPMALIEDGFTNRFSFQERPWKDIKSGFTHFAENDVGLAKITPCLENRKSAVFADLMNGVGAGTTELHIFRTFENGVLPLYLLWFLKSETFIQSCIGAFAGAVGQQRVGKEHVAKTLLPIPPLAEQHRIVTVIESAFAIIDEIENSKGNLQTVIADTKSKILSLAMQGKLVPQDPADEPASVLLERIKTERARLVKAGKIKPDKRGKDTAATRDNSHYAGLPVGWAAARLGEIANIVMGQSPSGDSVTANADGMEFHQGKIYFTDRMLASSGQYTSESNKIADKDSVLLCVRAPVGIVNITDREIAIGRGLCSLTPLGGMTVDFLFHWLTALQQSLIEQATGTTFQAITTDVVRQQAISVPPLAEQRRIVTVIETMFARLDSIAAEFA